MAFFYPDTVTVSLPLDPELERWFSGNLSYDGAEINDSKSSPSGSGGSGSASGSGANRTGQTPSGSAFSPSDHVPLAVDDKQAWIYASQGILYYAFPVEITLGIVGGLLSLAAMARQRKSSSDSYLIGFGVASVLLLACGGTLKLQDYTAHSNGYQRAYGCIKSANDWLWYSALWILVVMTLERGLSLIQNHRHKTFCSAGQAAAVVLTVYAVCLVSALPEFWEYEPIETYDYVSNRTIVVSHLSPTADSPEYRILYFWYSVTITVFLPYPTMIVMTVLLAQGMRRTRHDRKRLLHKHAADAGASVGRRIAEDLHLTRLYVVMILLYVILSAPLTFLIIINGITPYWAWPADNLYNGLYLIFEFVFYFYFAIQLPLYLSYYDKFRHSFVELCCCCCCCCGRRRKHEHKPQAETSFRKQTSKEEYFYTR